MRASMDSSVWPSQSKLRHRNLYQPIDSIQGESELRRKVQARPGFVPVGGWGHGFHDLHLRTIYSLLRSASLSAQAFEERFAEIFRWWEARMATHRLLACLSSVLFAGSLVLVNGPAQSQAPASTPAAAPAPSADN